MSRVPVSLAPPHLITLIFLKRSMWCEMRIRVMVKMLLSYCDDNGGVDDHDDHGGGGGIK